MCLLNILDQNFLEKIEADVGAQKNFSQPKKKSVAPVIGFVIE